MEYFGLQAPADRSGKDRTVSSTGNEPVVLAHVRRQSGLVDSHADW